MAFIRHPGGETTSSSPVLFKEMSLALPPFRSYTLAGREEHKPIRLSYQIPCGLAIGTVERLTLNTFTSTSPIEDHSDPRSDGGGTLVSGTDGFIFKARKRHRHMSAHVSPAAFELLQLQVDHMARVQEEMVTHFRQSENTWHRMAMGMNEEIMRMQAVSQHLLEAENGEVHSATLLKSDSLTCTHDPSATITKTVSHAPA
ncbi:hypothetical protein EIP91_001974 [Steccherinum ochraceum]|uniref:Uncharacterized protein n=1 Tax=Steccherinum ochraceum TaxID=92696 RepID=A0A4R0RTQ4_9APHY|nr:hypothetical protein EIP91_001974 [Steccherinum ochraceum]